MSALLVRKRSFSSSSTIATRTRTARPLEGIFEFFEMPPLAEKLCAVKQFYLYFGIGRFERPNKSAHLNSDFEDSPHLVTVDHAFSIASLAGGQHLAQSPNSFQVVLWTNRRRIRETRRRDSPSSFASFGSLGAQLPRSGHVASRHRCIFVSNPATCGR